MKISTLETGTILLEEVFNSIVLRTENGEELAVCMRDGGFEFKYQGKWFSAKKGEIFPFNSKRKSLFSRIFGGKTKTLRYGQKRD